MVKIGAVADDLTGATTTGVLLARSGARTVAFFNVEAIANGKGEEHFDAMIVSSNSRPLTKEEAYEKVKAGICALKKMGIKYFSKRIDTTMRGGIGVEIDAMLDQLPEDTIAIVVPAMPQSRRVLVGGFSIIDGVPLIRTPVAQDVRTPVYENYIPKLIAKQTGRQVGNITLDTVIKGEKTIRDTLVSHRSNGAEVIVIDAVSIEDIEEIAKACVNLDWNVLAVDPGAFTAKLAYYRGIIKQEMPNLPPDHIEEPKEKTVLIFAGSATSVTKKQMEVLCEDQRHHWISLDPLLLLDGGEQGIKEIARAVEKTKEIMKVKPRAILYETALHGIILDLEEQDKSRGYASGFSAERINAAIGMLASRLLEELDIDSIAGLYTTGGDTMVNVCYQLGVQSIELIDYIIPQTDIGRISGKYEGMIIVGKGGLTGTEKTSLDIVERILKESARSMGQRGYS